MKVVGLWFGLLMLVLGSLSPYIQAQYAYTRPSKPDQNSGRVYELNMRGKIVFLNRTEHLVVFWMSAGTLAAGLIGAGLWLAAEKKERDKQTFK